MSSYESLTAMKLSITYNTILKLDSYEAGIQVLEHLDPKNKLKIEKLNTLRNVLRIDP